MFRALLRFWRGLNPEIVIGFLIATVFWIGILGWQAAYAPTEVEKQKCYEAAQHGDHKSEECKSLWEKATTDPVAFFTLWLVIFTGGLTASTILLWRAGEKQYGLLRRTSLIQSRDTRSSIVVSTAASVAAERSADIARQAMVAGQRAFIFPVSLVSEWLIGDQPGLFDWQFRPMWRNSGDTPTKNMTMHVGYELRDTPLPDDFDFDYPTIEIGTALIPPKTEYAGGFAPRPPNRITPNDIVAIQKGTKFLFFWGWAKYFDVFPETPPRITRFCWQILPMGDPFAFRPGMLPTDGNLRFPYVYNRTGNCADDECQ